MTMEITEAAQKHEPFGDTDHVAYGKDFHWTCSCGSSSAFMTTRQVAESRANAHERYCTGETTVKVV